MRRRVVDAGTGREGHLQWRSGDHASMGVLGGDSGYSFMVIMSILDIWLESLCMGGFFIGPIFSLGIRSIFYMDMNFCLIFVWLCRRKKKN
ncbi:hypothetical protein BZA77DRAFT_315509 [Pyronema omphalodes]|nr:hypothetical protein BZA77DRAFT_315509 [Pyronema omphalodes]